MSMKTALQSALLKGLMTNAQEEDITYKKSSGPTRSISVLVWRMLNDEYGNASAPVIQIGILNDGTNGVLTSELDTGTDTFLVEERPGVTAQYRGVSRIVEQDEIGCILELR